MSPGVGTSVPSPPPLLPEMGQPPPTPEPRRACACVLRGAGSGRQGALLCASKGGGQGPNGPRPGDMEQSRAPCRPDPVLLEHRLIATSDTARDRSSAAP